LFGVVWVWRTWASAWPPSGPNDALANVLQLGLQAHLLGRHWCGDQVIQHAHQTVVEIAARKPSSSSAL
jgi:hypothetical protein